jgi:hypothetical protein
MELSAEVKSCFRIDRRSAEMFIARAGARARAEISQKLHRKCTGTLLFSATQRQQQLAQ